MTDYDLVIRNGEIIDGSGGGSVTADVGIRRGVIADIGDLSTESANEEIDASGRIVTPGFVDVHTNYDGLATWDTRLCPNSSLGTTTVVMGNCGVGFAPCRPADREVLVQLMEGVEEIPGSALVEGIPWTWESFPEFLDELEKIPRDIDTAALLPHGPLRVFVMGQRGVNREPATADDIAAMQEVARQALNAGAVGFSTSRTLIHRSANGEFIPSYQADHDELKALGRMLDGGKHQVFQMVSDWDEPEAEFDVLRETCRETGANATFTLLIQSADDDPDPMWRQHLARIEAAEREGLTVRGQVLSRPVGMIMGYTASMCTFSDRPTLN
ncbi:MAG: amidohydrolase family protein, partial [Pseudomonadota bacterium]